MLSTDFQCSFATSSTDRPSTPSRCTPRRKSLGVCACSAAIAPHAQRLPRAGESSGPKTSEISIPSTPLLPQANSQTRPKNPLPPYRAIQPPRQRVPSRLQRCRRRTGRKIRYMLHGELKKFHGMEGELRTTGARTRTTSVIGEHPVLPPEGWAW